MSEDSGVVLVGLSGSGKSTVGACLAQRLGRPFVDLDALVTETTGRTPAEHIDRDGEDAFRAVESRLVERVSREPGSVVATGGGAVIDPLSRWRLWAHGPAVWLDAPAETLAARLGGTAERRPLIADDPVRRLADLADARAPFYRAAGVRVDASLPLGSVVDVILAALPAARVAAGRRTFDAQPLRRHPVGPERARIVLGRDLDAAQMADAIGPLAGGRPSLIADRVAAAAVPGIASSLPQARRLDVPAGEAAKRLASLEEVVEWLSRSGAERGDAVLALGGGTLGDLAGFAAAVYLRGVPLVQVPTTWLAQADSAIGGKVAVDLAAAKNAVGATWPAWAVIADVAVLRTLPEPRLRDGLAECLKAGLIGDPAVWRLAEEHGADVLTDEALRYALLERAVRLKLAVVDRDPYETGERRTLNLGHTLGHALEVESGYRLSHGAAVALGIRAVASMAAGRGAEPDLPGRIDAVLSATGFALSHAFDPGAVRRALVTDKKRARGRQRWILPLAVGRVIEVDDVSEDELDAALRTIGAEA